LFAGSDENGVAISMKAKKEGISPQEALNTMELFVKIILDWNLV
jgi:methionyl-tRNA synthetase